MFTFNQMNDTIPLRGDIMSALMETVAISKFNRGQAGKIFGEVKKTNKSKVVIKNNEPEVIIMSPEKYDSIMKDLEEYREYLFYKKVAERIKNFDKNEKTYSREEIMEEFGISEEDIRNAPDDIE